uniref:C2HC/C3H-type domain-containing protein n=2 Tax=Ascaris TaxID=6251 RepID=F1L8A1_ASCSU
MATLPSEGEKTYPCEICGRQFIKTSLEKHEPVCKKMSKSRRKVFDSGKQRATGSDVTINDVRNAQREREKLGGTYPRPKTSWREKHETFVSAVSASRQVDYALKTGTPLPPPPKTSLPKDYVQCEYCGRNFNANAAERHIPFCRDQYERKGPMKVNAHAARPLLPKHNNTNAPSRSMTAQSGYSASSQKGETPPRPPHGRGPSRRASMDRERSSTTASRQSPVRATANSATIAHRSNLPTPIKRSSSASRVATTSHSRGQLKTPSTVRHPVRY